MKMVMQKSSVGEGYLSPEGHVLKREYTTFAPNGVSFQGRWVLRDRDGVLVDYDQYVNDIAERQHLNLYPRDATV